MEMEAENMVAFDMGSLRSNLPMKRGLSRYYTGRSRSFTCMTDVHCVEDLKKPEHSDPKKRKKYSERKDQLHNVVPPYSCRVVSGSGQSNPPCVGV